MTAATVSTEPTAGIASTSVVTPVATARSTSVVPSVTPVRYGAYRRMPYAEPTATRLTVAGPGLPITASEISRSGTTAPHKNARADGNSGTFNHGLRISLGTI